MNPEIARLKHRLLELDVAAREREDALRRGEMVLVKDLMDWLEALPVNFDRQLRQIFVERLPIQCAGKSGAEIRVLNSAALNAFAEEITAGNLQFTAKIQTQQPHEKTTSSTE